MKVDQDLCIGCGACATIAPNTFVISEETNKAQVAEMIGDSEEKVQEAKDACPVGAISIEL